MDVEMRSHDLHRVFVSSPDYADEVSLAIVKNRVADCLHDRQWIVDQQRGADVHIHVGTPDSIPSRTAAARLVAYSFAEANVVPQSWVDRLNMCDEVWAGSKHTADAFLNSGYKGPIRTIPLGIQCPDKPLKRVNSCDEPFTFLWQGTRCFQYVNGSKFDGDRKRGTLVGRAFEKLNRDDTRLILKSIPVENRSYDFRCGRVWRICKNLSTCEIRKLDSHVDAFVWPTMGEGFGLIPLEKLAHGIAAFPTFWSGPVDYITDFPLRRLIPSRLVDVTFNGVAAQMADVSLDDLVDLMHWCVEHRSDLLSQRATLHKIAKDKWDYKNQMAKRIREAVTDLCRRQELRNV